MQWKKKIPLKIEGQRIKMSLGKESRTKIIGKNQESRAKIKDKKIN